MRGMYLNDEFVCVRIWSQCCRRSYKHSSALWKKQFWDKKVRLMRYWCHMWCRRQHETSAISHEYWSEATFTWHSTFTSSFCVLGESSSIKPTSKSWRGVSKTILLGACSGKTSLNVFHEFALKTPQRHGEQKTFMKNELNITWTEEYVIAQMFLFYNLGDVSHLSLRCFS